MDRVVLHFLENSKTKNLTLSDLTKGDKKLYDNLKGETKKVDFQPYQLGAFRLFMPKTYSLVFEIVENFISKFNTEYYFNFKHTRNNKLIGGAIHDFFSLKVYEEIEKDTTFRNDIVEFEGDTTKDELAEKFKILYKKILTWQLEEYFKLIKMFSLLFVSKMNQKEIMQRLGIYKPYKPKGNKLSGGRELIYNLIPYTQKRLVKKYGDEKGKSDIKATVKETIKLVEKRNAIPESYITKVYNGYLKYNPHKVYQDLIREGTKELMKQNK